MIGFSATPSDFPEAHVVVAPMLTATEILDNSPAALSGMQVGDQIISATDNSHNAPSEFITPENFISYIQAHGNTDIHVTIVRNKDQKILDIAPKANVVGDKPGIGAGIDMIGTLRLGFLDSIKTGFTQSIQEFKAILAGVGSLVSSIFTGNKKVLSELSGPIGIAKYGGMAAAEGIGSFLAFMAVISINLAVVNLLPFPALDGGRIVLEIFACKGKSKISPRIVNTINQIGFLLLILLMLVVTYHDIIHVL